MKDPTVTEETNFSAIAEINSISLSNPKPADSNLLSSNAKKVGGNKKTSQNTVAKVLFDPYFYEKSAIIPTISEKMKIIQINYNFERMLRNVIIECMNKSNKIEGDLEIIKEEFEEFYMNQFAEPFIKKLAEVMKKDIIKFEDVKPVVVDNQNI